MAARRWSLNVPAILLLTVPARPALPPVEALPRINPFSGTDRKPFSRKRTAAVDHFPTEGPLPSSRGDDDDDDDDDGGGGGVLPASLPPAAASAAVSVLTALYGSALLLHPRSFPSQVHIFTVMRATGFDRIEVAIVRARQNFRQAVRAAAVRAPSFLMAARSIRAYRERIEAARALRDEVRRARLDGEVTPDEERRIRRLRQRQIVRLRRDIRRVRRAGSALGRVWEVLDLDEIRDVLRGMMFQATAVLASGHSESLVGTAVSRYCRFLNLGDLALDVNRRIDFPLSRIVLYGEISDDDLEEEERAVVRRLGRFFSYSAAAYLVTFRNDLGDRLNSALIASTVTARGLVTLIGWREGVLGDFEESLRRTGGGVVERYKFKKRTSGFLIIALTVLGMCWPRVSEGRRSSGLPRALLRPLEILERAVHKFVLIADRML